VLDEHAEIDDGGEIVGSAGGVDDGERLGHGRGL
jgi:hypothetical protein